MNQNKLKFYVFFALILFPAVFSFSQERANTQYESRFNNGIQLYNFSRWHEAAAEFRGAQEIAGNTNDWAHALYWVILSELAYADYGSAIRDMDELEKTAPNTVHTRDMAYHRGRVYYNLGYLEDAFSFFNNYVNSVSGTDRQTQERRASAYFWMGECLFSMGQYDEAEKVYAFVIENYPDSSRKDICSFRLDLIKQKRIEVELLTLLQWSHEESLRSSEEHQRVVRNYEFLLNSYQRRISELTQGQYPVYTVEEVPVSVTPRQEETIIADDGRQAELENLRERAAQMSNEIQRIMDFHGGSW